MQIPPPRCARRRDDKPESSRWLGDSVVNEKGPLSRPSGISISFVIGMAEAMPYDKSARTGVSAPPELKDNADPSASLHEAS